MKEKNLVVKHNDLINARYSLSLNEQKMVFYAITKIDRDKERFDLIDFDINEFTELLGTTRERFTEIREIAEGLMDKKVKIITDKSTLVTKWLDSIEYIHKSGKIELEFSVKLIPYLLQLKGRFTQYELQNIIYFKNKYSIRMYELLKQYANMTNRVREFTLDNLKELLGCEDKYKEYKKFNVNVLKKTVKEINTYTDLTVDYTPIKEGRKVVGVRFHIDVVPDEEGNVIESLYTPAQLKELKVKCGLQDLRLSSKNLMKLYEIAVEKTDSLDISPYKYIELNYKYMVEKGSVRNKFTYLKKALEEDYAKAIPQLALNYIA